MALFNFRWPGKKDDAEPVAGAKRPSRLAQGESVEDMRRRARHRLIGAAVLVLIGVVGFPMLFDTQPRPIPVNIPIEIPDQANAAPEVISGAEAGGQVSAPTGRVAANASLDDGEEVLTTPAKPATSVTPAITAGAAGAAAVAGAVAVTAPAKPEVKPEAKPERRPEVKPEPKPEKPKKPEPEVKKPEPEVKKPEHKVEPKETKPAKPEPKAKPEPSKVDDSARARALLEGRSAPEASGAKESPKDSAAGNERFMVQIGAFAEVSKANEIKGKLGGGAFTQTIDTKDGKRTRVRMGPFKSREEADKAAARAKGLGLPASVFKG